MHQNKSRSANSPTASTPAGGRTLDDIIQAMTLLMDEIQQFLSVFVEQLEQCCQQANAESNSSFTAPQIQAECGQLEPMLRQHVEMLNAAWLRLESEQRELLQTRASSPTAASNLPSKHTAATLTSPVLSSTLAASGNAQSLLPATSHRRQPESPLPEEALLQEFERLRQDVRSARATPFA